MIGKQRFNKLFQIADEQQGLFTAAQAREAGYPYARHYEYVRDGSWIREARGIYRLCNYPDSPQEHLVLYSLWSIDKRGEVCGVYSHETALVIHKLSDVNPPKLHMTIPPRFRRRVIPEVLVLHRAQLQPTDVVVHTGFLVTAVYRTICDVIDESAMSLDIISQAIEQAWERGQLTNIEISAMRKDPRLDQRLITFILKDLPHVADENL